MFAVFFMSLTDENIWANNLNPEETEIISIFRRLDTVEKRLAVAYINGLYDSAKNH